MPNRGRGCSDLIVASRLLGGTGIVAEPELAVGSGDRGSATALQGNTTNQSKRKSRREAQGVAHPAATAAVRTEGRSLFSQLLMRGSNLDL